MYSRITGYYRPVQNWNDGKLQEYANRTEYDIEHSVLKKQDLVQTYLFTTKTCPNCKLAKEYLKGVEYVTVDAEENPDLTRRYGVMQAPTLVVVDGDKKSKYVNVSNIKKYVDQLQELCV